MHDFTERALQIATDHFRLSSNHSPLAIVAAAGFFFIGEPLSGRNDTWCPERVAISRAEQAGHEKINRLALAFPICTCGPLNARIFPCVICRQLILGAAAPDFVLTILGVRSIGLTELRAMRR